MIANQDDQEDDEQIFALSGDLRRERRKQELAETEAAKTAAKEKQKAAEALSAHIRNMNYLIIDDERNLRTLMKDALGTYGIPGAKISEAPDTEIAISIMKSTHIDFMFIDQEMPGMGGAEFVFRLRRKGFPIAVPVDLPIIMVTSHNEAEHVKLARNAGVTDFIAKPFSAAAVYKRIVRAISNPRPIEHGDDGYIGPQRQWLEENKQAKSISPMPEF